MLSAALQGPGLRRTGLPSGVQSHVVGMYEKRGARATMAVRVLHCTESLGPLAWHPIPAPRRCASPTQGSRTREEPGFLLTLADTSTPIVSPKLVNRLGNSPKIRKMSIQPLSSLSNRRHPRNSQGRGPGTERSRLRHVHLSLTCSDRYVKENLPNIFLAVKGLTSDHLG